MSLSRPLILHCHYATNAAAVCLLLLLGLVSGCSDATRGAISAAMSDSSFLSTMSDVKSVVTEISKTGELPENFSALGEQIGAVSDSGIRNDLQAGWKELEKADSPEKRKAVAREFLKRL